LKSLCCAYPGSYAEGSSSLGFHFVLTCGGTDSSVGERSRTIKMDRIFVPFDFRTAKEGRGEFSFRTMDFKRTIGTFQGLFFSVAYEMQILSLLGMLKSCGINVFSKKRGRHDPLIVVGGACTLSNPELFVPFADAVVVGEGEGVLEEIIRMLNGGVEKEEIIRQLRRINRVITEENDIDKLKERKNVLQDFSPVSSAYVTPFSVFKDMFLVEMMRGCPHSCEFCIMSSKGNWGRVRYVDEKIVLDTIPSWVKRVGLVGASVLDHPGIETILEKLADAGLQVGVSSMRAKKLDERKAHLLAKCGLKVATVALDAPSERIRVRIRKPGSFDDVINAAKNAKRAGIKKMRLYCLAGFDGETQRDYEELKDFCRAISEILPVHLLVSPVVPKRFTPLEKMEFMPEDKWQNFVRFLKTSIKGSRITCKIGSWREAKMEHIFAHLKVKDAELLPEL